MAAFKFQMRRLSHGRAAQPGVSALWALIVQQVITARQTKQYRRWIGSRSVAE
jgi:hypothetical protein